MNFGFFHGLHSLRNVKIALIRDSLFKAKKMIFLLKMYLGNFRGLSGEAEKFDPGLIKALTIN